MKILKLLSAVFLFSLTSCTVTENIEIKEDGSGKFAFVMDGSKIMSMIPKDSLNPETSKDMDSTVTFKSIFEENKDSFSKLTDEQKAKMKTMENFSLNMKMVQAKKQFEFSIYSNFKNVSELQDAMAAMSEVQNMSKKNGGDESNPMIPKGGFENNSNLSYSYNGKKFSRKAVMKKEDKKAKVENDSVDPYKMIYEQSTYVINYTFPKKVKKVSEKTALFSEDRKTITIEYPFTEYMDNPTKMNFEVEFE